MSSEPRIALTSASMCLRHRKSIACRWAKPGARSLHPIRLVGAVGHEIDAELALRRLDRRINLARRHLVALGIKLEVMDQRFHRPLHLAALRRRDLAVVGRDRPAPLAEFSFSQHCFMILADWRISSMRMR